MNSTIRKALFGLLIAQGVAHAAEGTTPIDQVVVEATRADLVKAAKDVTAAEERFYKRYNEVNKTRKYAMRCTEEADTGSRFKKKRCKPEYENDATSSEGRQFAQSLGRGASAGSASGGAAASSGVMFTGSTVGGGTSGLTVGAQGGVGGATESGVAGGGTDAAFIAIASGRPEFQAHLLEVASKNPDLMKLLREHYDAVQRYQAIYHKLNGSGSVAEASDDAGAQAK